LNDDEALTYMDHNQAMELDAVERYLLEEMTPQQRDDFEEHFFDCHECATDLRATAAFMDAAKKELKANPVAKPTKSESGSKGTSFFASFWPSVLAWSAVAALLLLVVYQNTVVFPRFRAEVAELRQPEVLSVISLVRGNSRGGVVATANVAPADSVLLSLDIPTQDRFSSYTCLVYSPAGALLGKLAVSPQEAKDTISIAVPGAGREPGKYTVKIQGNAEQGGEVVDLEHNSFVLANSK
jgi:hypothetical protein